MIDVYHRATGPGIAGYVLAVCVGVVLGLAIVDLTLAGLLMGRVLKETAP